MLHPWIRDAVAKERAVAAAVAAASTATAGVHEASRAPQPDGDSGRMSGQENSALTANAAETRRRKAPGSNLECPHKHTLKGSGKMQAWAGMDEIDSAAMDAAT